MRKLKTAKWIIVPIGVNNSHQKRNKLKTAACFVSRQPSSVQYLCVCKSRYLCLALFHKPLRRACGTADAYAVDALQPFGTYLVRAFKMMTIAVHLAAFVQQHFPVA